MCHKGLDVEHRDQTKACMQRKSWNIPVANSLFNKALAARCGDALMCVGIHNRATAHSVYNLLISGATESFEPAQPGRRMLHARHHISPALIQAQAFSYHRDI